LIESEKSNSECCQTIIQERNSNRFDYCKFSTDPFEEAGQTNHKVVKVKSIY